MKNTEKPARYLGALSIAAAVALALSACSSNGSTADTDSTPADQGPVASTPAEKADTPVAQSSESATETQSATGDDDQAVGKDKFEDVIKTAEAAISGGKVIDYEYDPDDGPDTYEVDVVDGNNVKHELDIDEDATTVTNKEKDDTLSGDDLKEFKGAKVGIVDAVKGARGQAGVDSVVDEVELEWENNKSVWEVKFASADGDTEVKVDAGTGKLIS